MKKLVSAVLATLIAAGLCIPAFAADTTAPFSDVNSDTTEGQAIIKMYENGCLAGYEDGTFRPNGEVTRAELVRIINQVFGFSVNDKLTTVDFSDNSNQSAWYYSDVRTAQQMGYISGFGDNSFRPQDNFTRQQACVVLDLLTNAPEVTETVAVSDEVSGWAEKYVSSAIASGLFKLESNNTFRATKNITRGELCVALAGFVKENTDINTTTTVATTEGTTETTTATQTTTQKSSSSSTSSGGSSSSSKTTTSTTTTETTTEATTSSKTESTTKATTSNKTETTTKKATTATTTATTTTTTEATTELTTASVQLDADLSLSLKRTAGVITKYVVPNCSTDAEKSVASDIASAMSSYMADTSFDVQSAANDAMDKYHNLSSDEKSELKKLIMKYCSASDLVKLRDTFFPGLTY